MWQNGRAERNHFTMNAANISDDDTGELPADLIDTKAAAQLAGGCHLTAVHRWIKAGKVRGWDRLGRLFVSRAEIVALFQPVQTASQRRATLPPTRRERTARQRRVEAAMREIGAIK